MLAGGALHGVAMAACWHTYSCGHGRTLQRPFELKAMRKLFGQGLNAKQVGKQVCPSVSEDTQNIGSSHGGGWAFFVMEQPG